MSSRVSAARFLAGTAAMLMIGFVFIFVSFRLQFGHNTVESAARCRTVNEKIDLAKDLREPKIVFIGGSSVHWGINAQSAGEAIGREGLNLGTFAALGPEVILWNARRALRPGDTAVLALEYNMYSERNLTADAISFALGCDQDFLEAMPPLELAKTVLAADFFRPIEVLRWELSGDEGGILEAPPKRSRHGDPVAEAFKGENSPEMKERLKLYRPLTIRVAQESMLTEAIAEFKAWAVQNDVKVFATWPNTIWFDAYRSDTAFATIRDLYARYDIPMLGDPQVAMYPADLFYDTQYHLSDIGIEKRTKALVPLLKQGLGIADDQQRHALQQ